MKKFFETLRLRNLNRLIKKCFIRYFSWTETDLSAGSHRVTTLESEKEPGSEGAPVQVVVGAAPAVAGEDAEDEVGAAGQDQDDDLGGGEAELGHQTQDDDQLDHLDEEIEHVDEDHALLSLSVGVFLVGGLQSDTRVEQSTSGPRLRSRSLMP